MDTYDLSHKLAYTGRRCPVPFTTGPEFTNSVPGVPVLSELRIFLEPDDWSIDNVFIVAREICRVLGPMEQFDIGITRGGVATYSAARAAAGNVARLTKLDPDSADVDLRISHEDRDFLYRARFPRLQFEEAGEDFWQAGYSTGAVKTTSQQ